MVRPRQVTDTEILTAARRCFLQHGPSVSTTVIAGEVGLSQAALFKRFGTKHDLMVRALLPAETPPWILHVEKGPDDRPVQEQLHEIAMMMSDFFSQMIPCMATLRAAVDPVEFFKNHPDPPPIRGRAALTQWIATAQSRGQLRQIDPLSTAQAFMGALHGRAFMAHLSVPTTAPPDVFVEHLLDVLWHGISPKNTDRESTP